MPAALSCLAQVVALERRVVVDHVPWRNAVGMTEKPGPLSTWTLPPSWSVATKRFCPPVLEVLTVALIFATTAFVDLTPEELRPLRNTLPTLYLVRVERSDVLAPVAGTPIIRTCPTRCSSVSLASGCFGVGVAAAAAAGSADAGPRRPVCMRPSTRADAEPPGQCDGQCPRQRQSPGGVKT